MVEIKYIYKIKKLKHKYINKYKSNKTTLELNILMFSSNKIDKKKNCSICNTKFGITIHRHVCKRC